MIGNVSHVVSGVMVAQYLQNVTKRLSLGSELLYQYGQTVPGNEIAIYTLAGRYAGKRVCFISFHIPTKAGVIFCHCLCEETAKFMQ